MSRIYSAAVTTAAAAAAAAFMELRSASALRIEVLEVGFSLNAATASSIGLVRSATIGTNSATVPGQPHDVADGSAVGTIDTAWSAAGTVASNYLRRIVTPASLGFSVIWVFPDPIVVTNAATGGLFLWNFGAGAASILSAYAVWKE